MAFSPVSEAVAEKSVRIDRVRDPWDRFIVATALALALDLPLVIADRRIQNSGLVETVW